MKWILTLFVIVAFAACDTDLSYAQSAPDAPAATALKKPRTRIRVRPLYPYRHVSTDYPPPYDHEYPGPNAHRECSDGLAVEHRPSGTVIVPRMNCRWVRGYYPGP